MSGKAVAVPLRYDLINDPKMLDQTLGCLDGVIFTGGYLNQDNKPVE